MIKRLFLLATLGIMLSGCFMVPMAFVGPVISGFETASIIQSGVTTAVSYKVKKNTGKSITEHALTAINADTMQQSYFPENSTTTLIVPKARPTK